MVSIFLKHVKNYTSNLILWGKSLENSVKRRQQGQNGVAYAKPHVQTET